MISPYDLEIQSESDCVAPRTPEIELNTLAYETETGFFDGKTVPGMDPSSGLFDDLDLLDLLKDSGVFNTDALDETVELDASPDKLVPLDTDTAVKPSSAVYKPKSGSCMENPFFEEFVDLHDIELFPDLGGMELEMGEEFCAFMLPDLCLADVQVTETDRGSTQMASQPDSLSTECEITEVVCKEPVVLKEEVTVIETSDAISLPVLSPVNDALFDVVSIASEGVGEEAINDNNNTITDLKELFELLSPPDAALDVGGTDSVEEISVEVASPASTCSEEIDVVGSPTTKRTANELEDEPASKKAKVDLSGNAKISQQRIKNNIASRYSRASRKSREKELFEQEKTLEKDNDELKQEVERLTKLTQNLRQLLVQKLSGC